MLSCKGCGLRNTAELTAAQPVCTAAAVVASIVISSLEDAETMTDSENTVGGMIGRADQVQLIRCVVWGMPGDGSRGYAARDECRGESM